MLGSAGALELGASADGVRLPFERPVAGPGRGPDGLAGACGAVASAAAARLEPLAPFAEPLVADPLVTEPFVADPLVAVPFVADPLVAGASVGRAAGGADCAAGADDWADGAAAEGAEGAAFLAPRRPPFLIGSFASLSLRRRSTGASTVDEADRTNSPISFNVVRTSLLVTPSSFASS